MPGEGGVVLPCDSRPTAAPYCHNSHLQALPPIGTERDTMRPPRMPGEGGFVLPCDSRPTAAPYCPNFPLASVPWPIGTERDTLKTLQAYAP